MVLSMLVCRNVHIMNYQTLLGNGNPTWLKSQLPLLFICYYHQRRSRPQESTSFTHLQWLPRQAEPGKLLIYGSWGLKKKQTNGPQNLSTQKLYKCWISIIKPPRKYISLVVSAHLKNISQKWNLPQVGVKIKKIFELPPPRYIGPIIGLTFGNFAPPPRLNAHLVVKLFVPPDAFKLAFHEWISPNSGDQKNVWVSCWGNCSNHWVS